MAIASGYDRAVRSAVLARVGIPTRPRNALFIPSADTWWNEDGYCCGMLVFVHSRDMLVPQDVLLSIWLKDGILVWPAELIALALACEQCCLDWTVGCELTFRTPLARKILLAFEGVIDKWY